MTLAAAILTRELAQLPSRREEGWRWTDLKGLVRELPPRSAPFEGVLPPGPFAEEAAETLAIINGLGPEFLRLAPGERRRVAVRFVSAGPGSHVAKLAVEVGEGAELTLLESHEGHGETYVVETDLSIRLAAGARLERVVIAEEAASAVTVCRADIALSPRAVLAQTILVAGARRQRQETRVAHSGGGAKARLDGVYLIGERRHGDLTSVVIHEGVDGKTEQLAKGVAYGQGRAVFQGRITVNRGADRTDARMGHHALILSDRAEVDAKPELEIFADDVACAHGNTVGALDAEALFYARQRGLTEAEARIMLIQAFVDEIADRIEDDDARACAQAWVRRHLEMAS